MSWKKRLAAAGLTAALALVVHFEGKVNRTYADVGGVPTICYGHTGPDVHPGMTATDEQCEQWAAEDLLKADAAVRGCVTRPMTDNVRSAFADLAYNIGGAKFCGSSIVRKYNAGDDAEACARLELYNKAAGKVLRGLQRRRAAERELCET